MAVFRNLKVVHKLFLVGGVMVVGFGGLGATYLQLRHVQAGAEARAAIFRDFSQATASTQAYTLAADSILKDFFLEHNPQLVGQFNAAINDANNTTSTLEKLAQNDRQQQLIYQLRDILSAYQRTAKSAIDALVRLGLDENSGLYGELRVFARSWEDGMQKIREESGKPEELALLDVLLLTARRHEKDFLARKHDRYVQALHATLQKFNAVLASSTLPEADKTQIHQLTKGYHERFLQVVEYVKPQEESMKRLKQEEALLLSLVESLTKVTEQAQAENVQAGAAQLQNIHTVFAAFLGTVTIVMLASLSVLAFSLTRSLRRLRDTVTQVAEGDLEARTRMGQGDELATLGQAFDRMLDERLTLIAAQDQERAALLATAEHENEVLNDSIVTLIQAVSQLSEKDLTVRVPVAEDVTGTVADALNFLTSETAEVLAEVTRISESVATASRSVKGQSDAVISLATAEREQVTETAEQLAAAAVAMNDIAALAQVCNSTAETAINRTQTALNTVENTVEGIHTIRDTIRETEKRIKRLGERSQEIGGAVNLINGIAERTHILALNASMHAASAGEAGRGFAVVAEEVQRLAENARQSTEQIAHLVRNIQTETTDTVATMNTVISQVVEGSRLAGQAGEQMRQTQQSTAELVASVRQIASGAQTQAQVSNILRDRAGVIVESTRKTSEQLTAQGGQATHLLDYAGRLVRAVRVFKLPGQQVQLDATALEPTQVMLQSHLDEDDLLVAQEVVQV